MKLSSSLAVLPLIAICTVCNQKVYDSVYRQIILQTMEAPITKENMDIRNKSIESLRELCNGQRSSYETENPTK